MMTQMGPGAYEHGDRHDVRGRPEGDLTVAAILTGAFGIVEALGGILSGSLSLVSDAGHMFVDSSTLLLSLAAILIARRLPTPQNTFGYHRAEVLAAILNCSLLLLVSAGILTAAFERFQSPVPIATGAVLVIATVGLIVNLLIATRLHGSHDVNIRSAYLHVLGDSLSSLAVIAGAAAIVVTGITLLDPLIAAGIVVLIILGTWPVLRDSLRILLQATPSGIDTDTVVRTILGVPGVEGVHHVHLWSLCSHINVLDAHIVCGGKDPDAVRALRSEIRRRLTPFDILHATLECEDEACPGCSVLQTIHGAPCCPIEGPLDGGGGASDTPLPPFISTRRLLLRPFTASDADELQVLADDPYIESGLLDLPHPYTGEHAKSWIHSQAERYRTGEEIAYAITLTDDRILVGAVGLDRIDREARRAEVGYWVGRRFWNRGYASEALIAIIGAAFSSFNLHRVGARHFITNPASGRVMEKAGMKQEGVLRDYIVKNGQFVDVVVWSAIEGEWVPPGQ